MSEIWKEVGYGYSVSNYGNVRNKKGKILKPKNNRGYRFVTIKDKNHFIHRLVATAFCENPYNLNEINHKNEIKHDNRAFNLEWCTHKYNCNYGTRNDRLKKNNNVAVVQYTLSGEYVAEYSSMHIAADKTNTDVGHICACCKGTRTYTNGFKWSYKY